MSKKKGKTPQPAVKTMTASAPKMEAFTFGEPVPVLDRRDILDYVECISNGRWYEPPVSFTGLAKSLRAAVHHSSPIYVKPHDGQQVLARHTLRKPSQKHRNVLPLPR